MKILAVTTRFPLPPIKGDKLRAWQVLSQLASRHEIHVVSFISPSEREHLPALRAVCRSVETVPFSRPKGAAWIAARAFSGEPFQVAYHRSPAMQRLIARRLAAESYDVIFFSLLRMTTNLPRRPPCPVVGDFVDSMLLNFTNRLQEEHGPLRLVVAEEVRRLRQFEPRAAAQYDAVTVVSERDRAALSSYNARVISNGVDTERFHPMPDVARENKIIFTGNLSYFPNVDAITHFAAETLPLIRAQAPDARLEIAGVNPCRRVCDLDAPPAVRLLGYVKDLARFMNSAAVAVCPTRCGSGIQNKMMEAMACGVPVVASHYAAEGMPDARDGVHFLQADSPSDQSAAVLRLLGDAELRRAIAANGLQLIRDSYSWARAAQYFESLFAEVAKK